MWGRQSQIIDIVFTYNTTSDDMLDLMYYIDIIKIHQIPTCHFLLYWMQTRYQKYGSIVPTLLVSSNFVGIQVILIATQFFHATSIIEKFWFTLNNHYENVSSKFTYLAIIRKVQEPECRNLNQMIAKKSKITPVPTLFLWRDYLLMVGWLIVPQKEYCRHRCNFRFFCHLIVTVRC